jgi:hypothetical protein
VIVKSRRIRLQRVGVNEFSVVADPAMLRAG